MRYQERIDVKPAHQRFLKHRLHYAVPEKILEAVDLEVDRTLFVIGDPDNGQYEWMIVGPGDVICGHSDMGYGIPSVALMNGLVTYWGEDSVTAPLTKLVFPPIKTA